MPIRSRENLWGAWAFSTGVAVAVVIGLVVNFFTPDQGVTQLLMSFLAILGLLVGYFVSAKDVRTFLIASVAVVVVSYMGIQGGFFSAAILGVVNVSKLITSILGALMILFVPATVMVAIKTVFSLASD